MKSSLSASPSFYASQSPVCSGSRFSTCPGKEERSPKEEAEEVVKADGKGIGFSARDIFGPVPSKEEAESAVSALQQICVPKNFSKLGEDEAACFTRDSFDPALLMLQKERSTSLPDSCLDLTKPRHQAYKLNSVLSEMQNKLFDSLQILRLNPSVQDLIF
ncbi:hypothetical protein HPP92_004601 [Vanilla planifolia]|uniref:Uncharacterized protein n=1 Tax=Vanilla planifolia TaxID=51239 RepID=A0A835RXS3_VANPL|nr:hypothetical protein HPP92_004601 [Vanilla planifolia]